jgi:fumarate hydratase subunit alpha
MREIPVAEITAAVAQLSKQACCYLPKDVYEAFQKARAVEPSSSGQEIIGQLMENADIARNEDMPICQDTGLAVIFIDVGQDVHFTGGSLEEAIHAGVARAMWILICASRRCPIRCSIARTPKTTPRR